MGWNLLGAWHRQMIRQLRGREVGPGSWEGRDQDAFWADADARRARERGR